MTGRRNKWVKPAILAVVLVAAGGLGIAAAKPGDSWHGHGGARHGGGHMSGMFMPGRHVEGKLAFLKAELEITEAQEQAWQSFADVVRKIEQVRAEKRQAYREGHKERRKAMKDDGSKRFEAPALNERIDRGLEAMEQRLAAFKEIGEAAKTLYGQLTEDQQRLADRMLSHGHGRRFRF